MQVLRADLQMTWNSCGKEAAQCRFLLWLHPADPLPWAPTTCPYLTRQRTREGQAPHRHRRTGEPLGHVAPGGCRLRLLPWTLPAVQADAEARDGMERGGRCHRVHAVRAHARTLALNVWHSSSWFTSMFQWYWSRGTIKYLPRPKVLSTDFTHDASDRCCHGLFHFSQAGVIHSSHYGLIGRMRHHHVLQGRHRGQVGGERLSLFVVVL